MIQKLSEINGNVSWMDWSMISILILFGTLVMTVMIMWWRVISNVTEVVHIRRLKARRGRKYAEGARGVRQNSRMTLLIAETLVALAISALIVLMLTGASF
ncbi:hypothetical protein [Type-D symbiont of Plautia stali]|uniref:hypothetical protein n=1 Tax=Type-D symbiont of Plautia stali TaxID=1560356 RepID=UPI000AC17D8A|nr:hypothetical protein [Type-D symbiont of Plautia stali]